MKGFLSLFVLTIVLITGCNSPLVGPVRSPAVGSISVQLGGSSGPRGASSVSIAQAQAASDWYEVIAYNADHTYYVSSGKGTPGVNPYASGVTIDNVALGTYTVIALAGRNTDVATKSTVLLGSGQTSVTVVGQGVAPANIVLTNILWDIWTWMSAPALNTDFWVSWKYDSGLPTVVPKTGTGTGASSWMVYNTVSGLLVAPNTPKSSPGMNYDSTLYGGLGAFKSDHQLTGLTTAGTYQFSLMDPVLVLNDPLKGYTNTPFTSVTGTKWKLPNDDDQTLSTLTAGAIDAKTESATFSAPAIGPTVTWGAGR